jgi:hypothetical protein
MNNGKHRNTKGGKNQSSRGIPGILRDVQTGILRNEIGCGILSFKILHW